MRKMTSSEKDLILLGIIAYSINANEAMLSKTQRKVKQIRYFYREHRRI